MDTGVTTVEELRRELSHARRTAWVRLLLGPEVDGVFPVRFCKLVIGLRPSGWEHRRWDYPGWTFLTAQITARAFVGLLTAGEVQELKLGELTCSFTLATSAQWYRLPSRQDYGGIEVPWPSCSLTLSIGDSQNNA